MEFILKKTQEQNYYDMFNLFSIFLIISKCKYIICGSGNVSQWIMFYRGNNKNVHQFLEDKWYTPICEIYNLYIDKYNSIISKT
jgi:hypothetical protein